MEQQAISNEQIIDVLEKLKLDVDLIKNDIENLSQEDRQIIMNNYSNMQPTYSPAPLYYGPGLTRIYRPGLGLGFLSGLFLGGLGRRYGRNRFGGRIIRNRGFGRRRIGIGGRRRRF